MNAVYRALSDPTRRTILKLLRQRDMTAGEISGHFPIAKPTLSKHFNVLKEADLIQGRRDGATITYTLNLSVLEDALCGLLNIFQISPGSGSGSSADLGADDLPPPNGSPPQAIDPEARPHAGGSGSPPRPERNTPPHS